MIKIVRSSTVPVSLNLLLRGQLKFLNERFEIIAVSSQGPELLEVESREGVQIRSIHMERKISMIQDFRSLLTLYLFLKKEKPTIIHSITPKAGLLSMIAGFFAGVPIRMHTFTGLIFPTRKGLMQQVLILMDKVLCTFATNVYPEGEGVKTDLIRYKITRKKLTVLANGNVNGVDLHFFSPSNCHLTQLEKIKLKYSLKEHDFIFVYVGRLVKDKGVNELVSAFKICQSRFKNIKLILVGDNDSESDPLESDTVAEIQSNMSIISVGFQADVRPYFAISHVAVLLSYREGFPNVVLQSGAMGLPSIVTDINGCNEIILHGKNGLIVPPKDVFHVVDAMSIMVTDHIFREAMANAARQVIYEKYSQKNVWEALLKEYKYLIGGHDKYISK